MGGEYYWDRDPDTGRMKRYKWQKSDYAPIWIKATPGIIDDI